MNKTAVPPYAMLYLHANILLLFFLACIYLCVQARRLEMTCGEQFVPNPEAAAKSTNVMDNWLQATLQGLVQVRESIGLLLLK